MILTDRGEPASDNALRPFGNGKLMELGKWLMAIIVAGLVSYFTALGAIEQRVTRVETKEETHFQEVLRQLDRIEAELIRLRGGR